MRVIVHPSGAPLRGVVPGPIDADAATIALAVAALARGNSRLLGRGIPRLPIADALADLGVAIDVLVDHVGRKAGLSVSGKGLQGLAPPSRPLRCGRSAAAMAVLAGMCVALPFPTLLAGDETTVRATMAAVARPLRMRGAVIEGELAANDAGARLGSIGPPIAIEPGGGSLSPLAYSLSDPRAWPEVRWLVKAAALISGLAAHGTTELVEETVSRDAVERMLAAAGAPLRAFGPAIELAGPFVPTPLSGELPIDPSLAALVVAAAMQRAECDAGVRRVPTRATCSGWLEAIADAGVRMHREPKPDSLGQPAADVRIVSAPTRGLELGGERAERSGAQLGPMVAIAARAPHSARSVLPYLDVDRAAIVRIAAQFGVDIDVSGERVAVTGRGTAPLRANELSAGANSDAAMFAAVLAIGADGRTVIHDAGDFGSRFPRFAATLRALGVHIEFSA
jgi:3-phosphoshikimate 1-carboxyvinyltransferase